MYVSHGVTLHFKGKYIAIYKRKWEILLKKKRKKTPFFTVDFWQRAASNIP